MAAQLAASQEGLSSLSKYIVYIHFVGKIQLDTVTTVQMECEGEFTVLRIRRGHKHMRSEKQCTGEIYTSLRKPRQ
jgi:hypothetical protein